MIYVVLFEDDDSHADMRPKYMPQHLAFLEQNASNIQIAGPLKQPDSGAGAGGLWLVEADSADTVQSLVETDPFWSTGLRKSVRVLEWKQVFAHGKRQI